MLSRGSCRDWNATRNTIPGSRTVQTSACDHTEFVGLRGHHFNCRNRLEEFSVSDTDDAVQCLCMLKLIVYVFFIHFLRFYNNDYDNNNKIVIIIKPQVSAGKKRKCNRILIKQCVHIANNNFATFCGFLRVTTSPQNIERIVRFFCNN